MTDFASPRGKLVTFAKTMANKNLANSFTDSKGQQYGTGKVPTWRHRGKESLVMSQRDGYGQVFVCLIVYFTLHITSQFILSKNSNNEFGFIPMKQEGRLELL